MLGSVLVPLLGRPPAVPSWWGVGRACDVPSLSLRVPCGTMAVENRWTAAGRLVGVIDLRLLREDPDRARDSQRARGEDPGLADALLAADERRRAAVSAADGLRAEQKALSKRIPRASPGERPTPVAQAKEPADDGQGARG